MSDSAGLGKKIASANDLHAVVRTMKALAASSIGQYENSVRALADYYRTIELGLSVCLRHRATAPPTARKNRLPGAIGAIVFGSDQGLVGRFNEVIAEHVIQTLGKRTGELQVWAVGERVHGLLIDAGLPVLGLFNVPNSAQSITPLIGQIQLASEAHRAKGDYADVYLFHNRPQTGTLYEPVGQRILPIDAAWQNELIKFPWPTRTVPEILSDATTTFTALIREYLFISLFRACAESLASENASRLAAMQRADKNIDELLGTLHATYHSQRQSGIDAELFDLIAGFEALAGKAKAHRVA